MQYRVHFGCTIDAHASTVFTASSKEELRRQLIEFIREGVQDLEWEPCFDDADDYRIIEAEDDERNEQFSIPQYQEIVDASQT